MCSKTAIRKEKFYLVWSSIGDPSIKHETFGIAKEEATRLALKHPNIDFYVMESVHCVDCSILDRNEIRTYWV